MFCFVYSTVQVHTSLGLKFSHGNDTTVQSLTIRYFDILRTVAWYPFRSSDLLLLDIHVYIPVADLHKHILEAGPLLSPIFFIVMQF